jgi:DNA-binding MarR family transcriptional regulator
MARDATSPYRFGDLLALVRRAWVLRMAREMDARGFPGYKISDAATVRTLLAGPAPVGTFAGILGVSRQAARKVARGLERRGYATTERDASDARRVNVSLTPRGVAYARAVTGVIRQLNVELADAVTAQQLVAVDAVLRVALENEPRLKAAGARIPRPRGPER